MEVKSSAHTSCRSSQVVRRLAWAVMSSAFFDESAEASILSLQPLDGRREAPPRSAGGS